MWRRVPWKRIAWIAGAAFSVYLVVGIILAGRNTPQLPPTQQTIDLRGGHILNNRITTKSWSFDYDHAQLSPDGTTGTVDGVHNGIVFRKGKPYLKISATHISLNTQSLDFTAVGKVHVERIGDPQKRSFDTDLVMWTNGAKLLRLDHPSYLHSGTQTMRLDNVTINFDTEQIHMAKLGGSFEYK